MLLRPLTSVSILAVLTLAFAAGCSAPVEEEEEGVAEESALTGRTFREGAKLRVTANRLNVRSGGSTRYRIIDVLDRDDVVTVIETSGSSGWVHIKTPDETEGWAAGNYLTPSSSGSTTGEEEEEDTTTADGPTCSPARAANIVNRYQKALHDTIAFAEGTRGSNKDGYNVLFTYQTISSCARHPNRTICSGGLCSTAAGRYQFLHRTWSSIANTRGYATFEPENQERGAAYLIASVRRATIPTDRPLTAAEFENVMSKLSYEWASLPPGRYGQPQKSISQLRQVYCSILDC